MTNENPQIDKVLAISERAQNLWAQYQESQTPTLLAHIGYELTRAGVSAPELTAFFEHSGIDTNGVKHVREYIEYYDKAELDAYHVEKGEGESATLSEEKKQALLGACDSFREVRRENWNADDNGAGRRVREKFERLMGSTE